MTETGSRLRRLPSKVKAGATRKQRLAAALRENLKKRRRRKVRKQDEPPRGVDRDGDGG